MRKILMLLLASFFMIGLNAQQLVVFGNVADDNGDAVSDVEIIIELPSNNPVIPGYTSTHITDSNGNYTDTIAINNNQSQGIGFVYMVDCNGQMQVNAFTWFPNNLEFEINFNYCQNIIIFDCEVEISVDSSGAGLILTAEPTGTAPFTYEWTTGETTQSVTYDPTAIIYCVVVTDADGCITENCFFTQPNFCHVEVLLDSSANGGLILTANAEGTAPFTYEWNTGETTQSIPYSPNGALQCVTVTDATGCISESCYFGNPNNCFVFIELDSVNSGLALTANADGIAPFTYEWSTGQTTQTIPLDPNIDIYCVLVTDATGCVTENCFFNFPGNCTATVYEDTSATGGVVLVAEGFGVAPFTYEWDNGETTQSIVPDPNVPVYCVVVTDAIGCVAIVCYDFNAANCGVWLSYDCPIGQTPVLSAHASGTAPFTYLWSTGETTETIEPTDSGEYCVTVTDAEDCVATACMWIDVPVIDSCGVDIFVDAFGNSLIAEGWGVAPFSYTWSTGELTQSIQIDPNITDYCVTVVDADGCEADACFTIFGPGDCEVIISEVSDSSNIVLLWAEVIGGNPNQFYTYEWSTGETSPVIIATQSGDYCVTVTSSDGCVATACYTLLLSPNQEIGGWVHVHDSLQVASGMFGDAYLFKIDPSTGTPEQVDQTPLLPLFIGYRYDFGSVEDGEYLVRVVIDPNSPGFDDYLPTYYGDTELWDEATVITIPNNVNQSYDIFLVDANGLVGPGGINGLVLEGDNLVGSNDDRGEGDPVKDVSIILYDELENPVAMNMTNEDGEYSFPSLPWGTYKVLVEITGKEHAHYWVTIGPDNPNVNDLIFEVHSSEVTTGIAEVLVDQNITIFPNPTSADLHIVFELNDNLDAQFTLTDMTGKIVFFENLSLLNGKQQLNFNIADLPNGVFFANIITGKNVISQKIIKH
jgi:hypothetical protein